MLGSASKRLLDIVLAGIGLIPAGLVLLPVGVALGISTHASPLFKQERAGLGGRPFGVMKLRTMSDRRDAEGRLLPDAQRVTTLGRVVRRLSLDELPQLFNILCGDMSIVGPRPLPVLYQQLYTDRECLRLAVRPGLTGLAQVSGRQLLTFTRRLELDVWYVEHWSIWLDLKIMALTLPKLVTGAGVATGQDLSEVDDRGFAELFRRFQSADGVVAEPKGSVEMRPEEEPT